MQTPLEQIPVGFIGAGRLGCALAWRLHAVGCRVQAVASRSAASTAAFVAPLPQCMPCSAQQVVDTCDLVFVTTPDSAIETTVAALQWRTGQAVVHCSGATEVSALAKAAADGAMTGGFHPMQTFADPVVATETLAGCTVTVEASAALETVLLALAERLGCAVNCLPPGARAAYHAAAGHASQHINVILAEAVQIWRAWGADEPQVLRALLPMVRGTLASIEASGLARGMPGPVSRGDAGTVEKHVLALRAVHPDGVSLYRALCMRSVDLAVAAGAIDSTKADSIKTLLDQ